MRIILGIILILSSVSLLLKYTNLFPLTSAPQASVMSDLHDAVAKELTIVSSAGFSKVNVNYRLSNTSLQPSSALHKEIKRSFPRMDDSTLTAEVEVFDKLDQDPPIDNPPSGVQKSMFSPNNIELVFQVSIFRDGNKISEIGISKQLPLELFSDKKKPQ